MEGLVRPTVKKSLSVIRVPFILQSRAPIKERSFGASLKLMVQIQSDLCRRKEADLGFWPFLFLHNYQYICRRLAEKTGKAWKIGAFISWNILFQRVAKLTSSLRLEEWLENPSWNTRKMEDEEEGAFFQGHFPLIWGVGRAQKRVGSLLLLYIS